MKRYTRSQAIWTAMKKLLHRIAHWTSHNYGHAETFWHEGTLRVGFRCNCGKLTDVGPCRVNWP